VQNGDEISNHPKHEFDGWLMGGHGKALVCRASHVETAVDPDKLPATFLPGDSSRAPENVPRALQKLREALPPRVVGSVKEGDAMWNSQNLKMGDRVGVLFRLNRDGGAKMKLTVNGDVVASHEFIDAPAAEAIGFLTPIIRLAGTGKSAKLMPGLMPPSRLLAEK